MTAKNTNLPFVAGFQLSLLRHMITDEAFLIKVSKYLRYEHFSNKYLGWYYDKVVEYHKDYGQLPTPVYFQTELRKFSEMEREPYVKIMTDVFNPRFKESDDFIRTHLATFIKCNKIKDLYDEIHTAWDEKSPDEITDMLESGVEELRGVTFEKNDTLTLKDSFDLIEGILHNRSEDNALTLGIAEFDNALGGGLLPGELLSVYGDTNTGKSITLVNFAARFVQKKKRVLYVFTEGKGSQPILRLVSRLANRTVPYKDIESGRLDETQVSTMKNIIGMFDDYLMVKPMTSLGNTPSIEDVIAYCKDVRKSFPFDVLIVDYADMLTTRKKVESHRHEYKHIYQGLNALATNFNIPVITASQVKRDGKGRSLIRLSDTSEGYDKSRLASIVITLNRADKDIINNQMLMLLDKNRDGEARILVRLNTDFANMVVFGHHELTHEQVDIVKYLNSKDNESESNG